MQLVATGLLVALALLLAASARWQASYPALAWARAFAEAGLVGGLADWFAVVALFRHPLALPLPHTAILQRNKTRIGRELGAFVERNFLTPANIIARLEMLDLVGWAARWCARQSNAARLAAGVRGVLPELVAMLDDAAIEHSITAAIRRQLDQFDVAEISRSVLLSLVDHDRHQQALDYVIELMGKWLDANRATLRERFGGQSRWTPRWMDSYVVDKFVDGVIGLVDEVRTAPRHELRASFDLFVRDLLERLRDDEVLRDKANQLRHDIIARFGPERLVTMAWQEMKQRLMAPGNSVIERWLTSALVGYAGHLRRDVVLKDRLNSGLLRLIEVIVSRAGPQVSALIADVVGRWNAKDASRRIELEVGSDLQFIRINGSLVGGAAGLLIHACLLLTGQPG